MKKTIFLDRDGTINVEKNYLHKIEDFEFENRAIEALKILSDLGYQLIVVTNQSGIARGYYGEEDLEKLNNYMMEELKKNGVEITACYFCPHHLEKGVGKYRVECECRKPNPGMLLKGINEYQVDIKNSYMVGDRQSDLEAGIRAGVKPILVKTGYGKNQIPNLDERVQTFENLYEFATKLACKN